MEGLDQRDALAARRVQATQSQIAPSRRARHELLDRLEREYPGITRARRNSSGQILLEAGAAEEA